jgi:predicted CXXCH cytochrome family protein
MQPANDSSVLGKFDSTRFTNEDASALFFRRGDKYFVETGGEDGVVHEYPIKWTFGVYPLQQYIVELKRGRFQALTIAWDSRAAHEGGQRWFFLTPGHGQPGDRLHWMGREYNWNYSCADCHSTGVRKNYDESADAFRTSFAEIDVACEACHGPGSRHADWGRYPAIVRRIFQRDNRFANRLDERRGVGWTVETASGIPVRSIARRNDNEIETCAQCHSRRLHIADGYTAGKNFFDYYIPVTLAGDYHPDGQQLSENYNYGSFLQSRMYSAGVTCSDCHDPHTAKLRMPGNAVCGQCHSPARYDTKEHHHHIVAGTTGTCVSCHMPATTYMEIDARPDHSMRIPRPDLTATIGVPNACSGCHSGKTPEWAAEQIRSWYPRPRAGFQRFAEAFAADDRNDSSAASGLALIANDSTQPWFVRASSLGRLSRYPDAQSLQSARTWINDPKPLVRLAALQILEGFGARERIEIAASRLSDPVLAVRKGAAWLFAPVADSLLSPAQRKLFDVAAKEFVASQRYNGDQPGDRYVLAMFFVQRGELKEAQAELEFALKLDPQMRAAQSALTEVERMMREK